MRLVMKPTSLELIRNSFVNVLFAKEQAVTSFYNRLFELAPETRALFRSDLEEQGRMFVEALAKIVTGLGHIDLMLPSLEALAVRHVHYGVREQHYAIVGSALLHMVHELSGPSLDTETERAWTEAYGLVSSVMINASRAEWRRTSDRRAAKWPERSLPKQVQAAVPPGTLPLAVILIGAGGIQALLSANLWAEVSTSIALSGGSVVVARRAFGDTAALIIGWTDALSCVAGAAQAAAAAAGFLAIMLPVLSPHLGAIAASLLIRAHHGVSATSPTDGSGRGMQANSPMDRNSTSMNEIDDAK